jgi:phosphonate transport system substrate-binding protein
MRASCSLTSALSKRCGDAAALAFALSLLVCVAGCGERAEVAPAIDSPRRTLRIGLIPEQNIFTQKKRYKPLAAYLSKQASVNIELKVLSRYGNIIQNFVSNRLDGAFFGSFTGALAHRKLGVEALARPEYLDGTSTYHGLLFVRRDSRIANANDMKGKRFVFVDKATTAGWLLPLYYFKMQGIDDYRSWLKEAYFAGTHESAIYDVLERTADIGAAKNTVFSRLAGENSRVADDLVILARSPEVPENGLCVRGDLEGLLKMRLREALLNMERDPEAAEVLETFGARRFIQTVEADYASVFEYAEKIGLDLETYDYMNE